MVARVGTKSTGLLVKTDSMDKTPDTKEFAAAGRVCDALVRLSREQPKRWNAVQPQCLPYGDLAYGMALVDWYKNGCPKSAWFSYDPSQLPCPFLMEFRKELTAEFGLRILTHEEHLEEQKLHR